MKYSYDIVTVNKIKQEHRLYQIKKFKAIKRFCIHICF